MDQFQGTIGQKIAQAAGAFEQWRTRQRREWIAVLMNEETIVIALHGCLTASEKALAGNPAGAAELRDSQRRLFSHDADAFVQKIKVITGMHIRSTTVDIDPTIDSVVQNFTTDTSLASFLSPAGDPTATRTPRANDSGLVRRAALGQAETRMAPAAQPIKPADRHPRSPARM